MTFPLYPVPTTELVSHRLPQLVDLFGTWVDLCAIAAVTEKRTTDGHRTVTRTRVILAGGADFWLHESVETVMAEVQRLNAQLWDDDEQAAV